MPVTQDYKTLTLSPAENGVVAMSRTAGVLQFVNKPEVQHMLNRLHETAQAGEAKSAVNLTILIAYADLHTLALDGFFSAILGLDQFHDGGIKISYLFADDHGRYHCIPHTHAPYVEKYFRSVAA